MMLRVLGAVAAAGTAVAVAAAIAATTGADRV